MISTFEEIKELLVQIDAQLQSKVDIYAIGGLVLLYHKLKPATKDLDLIVSSGKEYHYLKTVLHELKFIETKPEFGYDHFNLSQILISKDFRIDLFSSTVCKGFSLSKDMIHRAEKVIQLSNLSLHLCSNEDTLLFKTMTEREGDLNDCIALASRGLDWNSILKELKHQIHLSGRKVWITWVGERLDLLIERGLNIPIMKEVDQLRIEYYEEFDKKLGE